MIRREDAELLREVGTIGQIDGGDPSFLFRIADHIEAALGSGLYPDFTRDDVDALNAVATYDLPGDESQVLRSIADRIEAMLPPDSAVAPPSA